MIREAGSSGIAATTWDEDPPTTSGKSSDGGPWSGMLLRYSAIAQAATSVAIENNGKLCFTGPTIPGFFKCGDPKGYLNSNGA